MRGIVCSAAAPDCGSRVWLVAAAAKRQTKSQLQHQPSVIGMCGSMAVGLEPHLDLAVGNVDANAREAIMKHEDRRTWHGRLMWTCGGWGGGPSRSFQRFPGGSAISWEPMTATVTAAAFAESMTVVFDSAKATPGWPTRSPRHDRRISRP